MTAESPSPEALEAADNAIITWHAWLRSGGSETRAELNKHIALALDRFRAEGIFEIEAPDGMKMVLNAKQEIKDVIYGMRWLNSEHLLFLKEKGLTEEFSEWALKRHYGQAISVEAAPAAPQTVPGDDATAANTDPSPNQTAVT